LKAEGVGSKKRETRSSIGVRNLQRRIKIDGRGLKGFLLRVAGEVGPKGVSATLALVGDRRLQALNRIFRGVNRTTDVLAFSVGPSILPEDNNYLGDIVISVDAAEQHAKRRKSTLRRELRVLALHGYLHLLGYDHETDDGEMRRIEYRLRRRFEITPPRKKAPGVRSGKRTKKK
jgi:probable rRNA maturation factor